MCPCLPGCFGAKMCASTHKCTPARSTILVVEPDADCWRTRADTHTHTYRTKEGGKAACDEKPGRDENPHTGRQFERQQHSGKGVLGCVRNAVCTQRCATNLAGRDVVDRAAHIGMVAVLHRSFVRTSPHFASQQLPPFARRVFRCTQKGRGEGSAQPRFTSRSSTSQFDTTKQWEIQKVERIGRIAVPAQGTSFTFKCSGQDVAGTHCDTARRAGTQPQSRSAKDREGVRSTAPR
jgi:hypothetical protein